MSTPVNITVAIAWYRREQWGMLRAVSADAAKLEESYDDWLEFASRHVKELEARGIGVHKIDVEVGALTRWCKRQRRPVDGEARAEYAQRGLGPRL